MKKDPQHSQIRFNLYLSAGQTQQVRRLFAVGLTMSAIARQAIRKCSETPLLPDSGGPFPTRCNFYLEASDAESLSRIALRENSPKAAVLRRLIHTYLTINVDSINKLF